MQTKCKSVRKFSFEKNNTLWYKTFTKVALTVPVILAQDEVKGKNPMSWLRSFYASGGSE